MVLFFFASGNSTGNYTYPQFRHFKLFYTHARFLFLSFILSTQLHTLSLTFSFFFSSLSSTPMVILFLFSLSLGTLTLYTEQRTFYPYWNNGLFASFLHNIRCSWIASRFLTEKIKVERKKKSIDQVMDFSVTSIFCQLVLHICVNQKMVDIDI